MSNFYRYDRIKQEIIDYHIEKMLREGTIHPIQSPYASPVFLTRSNNELPPDSPEAYRFAIDYRKFNAVTKYPRYPLPVIDDLIANIPHNGVMSTLDLKSGYFQLEFVNTAVVMSNTVFIPCTVDGTWQRRGYNSMNGCVAALSVDTGTVVDIEIMSSYCPTCRKISKMPSSIESETFAADHVCHSNFQGFALKMEAVGSTRIFQCSIVKRGLKYAHYYGDGDSKGFISVKDTYGKDSVTKYECIGHVQKRVGARLRKLKSKNKNLSGEGKLTDSFIDRLQNYYGIAVRSNVGNLSGLQQNVIAALFHCSSSVEKLMHGQCPIGKDSWCYYQRALSCGKKPNEKYKGLSNEVLNTIKPTYLELCTKELLTKCLHGKTQNSNQCLNGVIWQRAPEEIFVCLKTLKSSALDAVIQFNDGYKGCVEIFKNLI
ncbi:uncharacterized protein TNCV_3782721 [Trichonephila clavipes]|nr:uncharacterized protein TNCV_3782721 [Trichonephila clavipes]